MFPASFFVAPFLLLLSLALLLFHWLWVETQEFRVCAFGLLCLFFILTAFLSLLLLHTFVLFFLFAGHHFQLLLFDPVGVDFALFDGFSLRSIDIVDFNALVAIVFVKSESLRFFWFGFFDYLFSALDIFLSFGYIFFLIEFVVEISDVTSSSALFARSVISACSASAVMEMAIGELFFRTRDEFLLRVFIPLHGRHWLSCIFGGLLDGFLGLLDLLLFDQFPLLMGCINQVLLFLGGFWVLAVGTFTKSSSSSETSNAANGFMYVINK